MTEQATDIAKKVAKAFKADGAIGKECMLSSKPEVVLGLLPPASCDTSN